MKKPSDFRKVPAGTEVLLAETFLSVGVNSSLTNINAFTTRDAPVT